MVEREGGGAYERAACAHACRRERQRGLLREGRGGAAGRTAEAKASG